MAVIALILYYISENSRIEVKSIYYDQKIAASEKMLEALKVIRDHRAALGVFPEELGDPLVTIMIGEKYSQITTEEGLLSSKLTALNPNFAAAIMEMLEQAGAQKGDKVAIGATGSFPGLNLAVYSACDVLGVELVQISSLGSSSWGANSENFTWLDMETVLREKGIFKFKSVAASIGGGNDIGIGLSQHGRDLLRAAAKRNSIPLIEEPDLLSSINKRMEIYGDIKNYKAYINIGGGIASLGHQWNSEIIEPGLNHRLPLKNYPGIGVINLFGTDIAVIHLEKMEKLIAKYSLPLAPNPLPPVGIGRVFMESRYDLRITIASLVIIALMLAAIFRLDKKLFKFSQEGSDPETLTQEH